MLNVFFCKCVLIMIIWDVIYGETAILVYFNFRQGQDFLTHTTVTISTIYQIMTSIS